MSVYSSILDFYTSTYGRITGNSVCSTTIYSSSRMVRPVWFSTLYLKLHAMVVIKDKKQIKLTEMAKTFADKIKSIVPTIAICLFGYMFGALFNDLNVAAGIEAGIAALNIGKVGLCIVIPLLTCILGIAIVGSSMVVVFGGMFISMFAAVGVDPLLIAAMLPCICGVMSNMVPPIAPAFLAGVSLSGADFAKSVKNDLWWIVTQYLLEVVILLGFLPVLGM